ncbi:MAG: hypothetical protein A3J99_06990 [Sideroxydans sp. RIFOXYD2_FULL_59_7]|nr:MAG: hypothetical protein A3J99_06990 [Sideroxydans sp. RIFOXYD2_FULL_59_7]
MIKLRPLLAWLVLLGVAMLNGTLRDFTYGKHMSELSAHQLSTLIGILLFALVIHRYVRRWPPSSGYEACYVGLFWLSMTVAFEFLFFHYAGGHSWQLLLENYNMSKGRLWPLLLLWVAVSPYLFFRLARSRGTKTHN